MSLFSPHSNLSLLRTAILLAGLTVGGGLPRCEAQITDIPEWKEFVALAVSAEVGSSPQNYERYANGFVEGMSRMTPEQQARIFGYMPGPITVAVPAVTPPPIPPLPVAPPSVAPPPVTPPPVTPPPVTPPPVAPPPVTPPPVTPPPVTPPPPTDPPTPGPIGGGVVTLLNPPSIDPPSGVYPGAEVAVTISNPNVLGTSVMASVNGGPFLKVPGTFTVGPDSRIEAYAFGDPLLFVQSDKVAVVYASSPSQLNPPAIALSATAFVTGSVDTVTATLTDPNDSAVSSLQYRVGSTGVWGPYTTPLTLLSASFPTGVTIEARAVTTSPVYADSGPRSASVAGAKEGYFVGHTDGYFEKLVAVNESKLKHRHKLNNGHGNNYDGVDGSNPSTIKKLLEAPGLPDDEIKAIMPKNSNFLESGAPAKVDDLPNGSLLAGTPFSVDAGASFPIGTFSYFNGSASGSTEVASAEFTVDVEFTKPIATKLKLYILASFSNGNGQAAATDFIRFAAAKDTWPLIVIGSKTYELIPTFAIDGKRDIGTQSESVSQGETRVFQLQAVLRQL